MTCSWCEEEKELARLCNIESHRVCKECYGKYRVAYPLRVEGCPYCRGNEEKLVIQIEIPQEVELPEVYITREGGLSNVVERQISYHGECDTHQVGATIAMVFIVLMLFLLVSRLYGFT